MSEAGGPNSVKLRILWLCNRLIEPADSGTTGTWLGAMAEGLLASGEVELGVIAPYRLTRMMRKDCGAVSQWLVPTSARIGRNGLPLGDLVQQIAAAAREFGPDLVHVWGTESYWGLLSGDGGVLPYPAVLTMQGVKYRIAKCFDGGMTVFERWAATGLREVAKLLVGHGTRRAFARWEALERRIMARHKWVICQTSWQAAQVKSNRPDAEVIQLDLPLRRAFEKSGFWQEGEEGRVFTLAAYAAPFKGLHLAVRVLALLRRTCPKVRLRIAGVRPSGVLFGDGYLRWVRREARRLGVTEHVEWLGALSAEEVAAELRAATVMVLPTFIESYCMAMVEAMRIGTPVVASYTGGLASLASDEESALFFPPGDEAMCAHQLLRILSDRELASKLSQNARHTSNTRHVGGRIAQRQVEIYREVLAQSNLRTMSESRY